MTTLISLVVLCGRPKSAPCPTTLPRQIVFSERIRVALGEAWRVLIG